MTLKEILLPLFTNWGENVSDSCCFLAGTAGCDAEVRGEDSVDDEVRGAIRVAGRPYHHGSGEFSVPLNELCNGAEIGAQLTSSFADCAGGK
jgi:hypothetical protein